MTMRWIWIGLAALCIVIAAPLLVVLSGFFNRSVVDPSVEQPLAADEMQGLARDGRYLVRAADCYACHTEKGGPPWAGGMGFETPFGTIYATNISPDPDTGIGTWSRADFHRAVRDGRGKHGYLYPAMPYTSYRLLTTADVDAMYAYLMTREPIRRANKPPTIPFPLNIRRAMTVWNLINLSHAPLPEGGSPSRDRGSYIVNALGHCGECHTPRNFMMAMKPSKALQGAVLEGVEAPDITPTGLDAMGFEHATLARFMKAGVAPQGAMTHQMFDVVHYSTQFLTEDDLTAMTTYLLGREVEPPTPAKPVDVKPEIAEAGRSAYLNVCAGCHGYEGEGIPHVSVPMRTNASLRLTNPRNFLVTVLHGLPAQEFPGLERMQPMPGFAGRLTDQQIADLTNWMRATWGGRPPDVTPETVSAMRQY